jgi:hypothetical protein
MRGPLRVDVGVAELLLAQLAITCAPRNEQHEKEAIRAGESSWNHWIPRSAGTQERYAAFSCGCWVKVVAASALPDTGLPRRKANARADRLFDPARL